MVLVAALVLALQSFLTAWAAGAMPMLDTWGNPLCVNSVEESGAGHGEHANLSTCCAMGCVSGFSALAGPDADHFVAVLRVAALSLSTMREGLPRFAAPAPHPGNPRAPPAAA